MKNAVYGCGAGAQCVCVCVCFQEERFYDCNDLSDDDLDVSGDRYLS